MFPLHARGMALFDIVEGGNHQLPMDDIYNLSAFFEAVYNQEKNYLLVVLQGKEWETPHHGLNKSNLIKDQG